MQDAAVNAIVSRIASGHSLLIKATESLDEEDFCRQFGAMTPPIGWHLWHMGRWADRVQASLPRTGDPEGYEPNPNNGLWEQDLLTTAWDLDLSTLGTLESGSGMPHEAAASLPKKVGKATIVEYAKRSFARLDDALQSLDVDRFGDMRPSVMEFEVHDGKLYKARGKETTVAADLAFHFSHVNRHLGMIEALRGFLMQDGSITV